MKIAEETAKSVGLRRLRLSLGAWRRLERRVRAVNGRPNWRVQAAYWLSGAGHSLLSRIQSASHAEKIRTAVARPPLFLLGFWRSGTTFLHELFGCDARLGFASTYACLNPSHFLLTEGFMREQPSQPSLRPMDNMRYSWVSPQEDEFALLALGAPSAYEALIFPSLMRNPRSLLDPRQRPRDEQARWADTLQHFLRLLTVQQDKPIVLKSPPHGFRLPVLSSLFPHARYVLIERNPYEVFASNLKLWRSLLDMYSLESISAEEIEAFVLSAYVLHEEAIAEGIRQLDTSQIARVRYEELVANPVGEMARLYQHLGLEDFEAARMPIERHLEKVADHKRNRFRLSPSQKQGVDAVWGALIERKKYGWPHDHVALE